MNIEKVSENVTIIIIVCAIALLMGRCASYNHIENMKKLEIGCNKTQRISYF